MAQIWAKAPMRGIFFCNISLVIWLIFDPMKSFIKIIIISKLFNKWTPYLFCKQTWPKSLYFSIGQSNKLIWSKVIVKQKKYPWLVICLIFETMKKSTPHWWFGLYLIQWNLSPEKKYPSLVIWLIFGTMKSESREKIPLIGIFGSYLSHVCNKLKCGTWKYLLKK